MPIATRPSALRRLCVPALLVFCTSGGFAISARAQTPSPFDPAAAAERQQREQQDRQREEFRRARESAQPPTVIETPQVTVPRVKPSLAIRREIRELQIDGAPLLSPARRKALKAAYEGRALGVEDLEQLLTNLTRYYLDRGYVTTRVYVPDQDLSSGVLRILVVEGRIGRLEGAGTARNIFPTRAGNVLNLRDLEQGIDNLNRLPSHRATLDLVPGGEPGETVVVIGDTRSRPWHVSVSADNTGSPDTGREQVSATLGIDDPLGFGESLSVTHRRALDYDSGRKGSESTTGSLIVPWGYQMFTLGGSTSSYALTFNAPSGLEIPFTGDSRSLFLRTDRVLFRNQTSRLNAYANVTWRSSHNYLAGSLIGVSSRDSVVADLGASYSRPLAGGFAVLDASLSRGLPIFGGAEDPAGLPDFAPHAEFTALKLTGNWSRSFRLHSRVFNFSTSLTAQVTPDVLFGSDQLTIGGIYAVRGFDRTNLAGDLGYVWRNDLSTVFQVSLGAPTRTLVVRPYVGLDQGRAWSNVSGIPGFTGPHGSLVGSTAGVSLSYAKYNADFSYARSLVRASSMPRETGHFYFRLNAAF